MNSMSDLFHAGVPEAYIKQVFDVMAQTPQVFRFDLLKRAFESARRDGFTGTDESSLVERLEEVEVSVVQGSDRNIKITRPTDMELARLFLSEETERRTAS